jgi:hypothetical protein
MLDYKTQPYSHPSADIPSDTGTWNNPAVVELASAEGSFSVGKLVHKRFYFRGHCCCSMV